MGMNLVDTHDALLKRRTVGWMDDFTEYTDTQRWTKGGTSSTIAIGGSTVNGVMSLATTNSDNGEAWIASTNKFCKFLNNKPLVFETRINYQEANTNTAGIYVGFSSAFATGMLANTTLIPNTNFSGAGIYKQTGDTTWRAVSSVGTGQNLSTSTLTNAGGASDVILRVEAKPVSSTIMEVSYLVWDFNTNVFAPLFDASLSAVGNRAIKHNLTYTSAAAMGIGVFVKTHSANAETVLLDYIAFEQLR